MPEISNRKEPKRKFALWIRESILDKVRKPYKSYLSGIVTSTLKGVVAESDNRQNRILFKLSAKG